MDKKKVFLWGLYDFANSIVMIVFFLYYSQWLVIEQRVSDFWFNMTFVASSVLLLLTAPVAGAIVDKIRVRMPGLRITTIISFLFFFITSIIAIFYPHYYILSAITFTLATYFYLFSFVFYNAILDEIAIPEKHGIASGWGQFGNWLGQIAGLLVTLPIATGAIHLWGDSERASALLPGALLFMVFALPMLIFFREKTTRVSKEIDLAREYRGIFRSSVNLFKMPYLSVFFLSYFFFNDAIITSSNNYPIYLNNVFHASDMIKNYLLLGVLILSAIGGPLSGWIADRIGLRKTLLGILVGWIVIFPALALANNLSFFAFVSIITGLWFGSIWTVTRALVTHLTPPSVINQSFMFYTLMERFATFIGPLSWGLLVGFLPTASGFNYRVAIFAMALFVLIGFLIARKLPEIKSVGDLTSTGKSA